MKKQISSFFAVTVIIIVATLLIWGIRGNRHESTATATGLVQSSGEVVVHEQPDLKSAALYKGGQPIRVCDEQQVIVTGMEKQWYQIRLDYEGQTHLGYVPRRYITMTGTDSSVNINGSIAADAVTGAALDAGRIVVRSEAGQSKPALAVDGQTALLPNGKQVTIEGEATADNHRWFCVQFSQDGTSYKGYVQADCVNVIYSHSVPAMVVTSDTVLLRKEAGSMVPVTIEDSPIAMIDGYEIVVVAEKRVNGVKYDQIEVTLDDVTYRGWLADNLVRFRKVQLLATQSPVPRPSHPPYPTRPPEKTAKPHKKKAAKKHPRKKARTTPKPAVYGGINKSRYQMKDVSHMSAGKFRSYLKKQGFPAGYIEPLVKLHARYPGWDFQAAQTHIRWSDAVANESRVGMSLIPVNKPSAWKSYAKGAYDYRTDRFIPYDGSTWVTASQQAVRYYMDPRNFLNADYIFQFENEEYQEKYQDVEGIENILKNTPMYHKSYKYKDDDGETQEITYAQTFLEAARASGVSPYTLASRVKQEVVKGPGSMSSSVSGTVAGYTGIYNYYNIGANNSTKAGGAVANGLSFAKNGTDYMRPWNNRYRALVGGALYIGANYVATGQSTLYLQKFNVTSKSTYDHQYMSNLEAPYAESYKTSTAYGGRKARMNILFVIPVYKDMPSGKAAMPSGGANPNNYLASLSVNGYRFSSAFKRGDSGRKTYRVQVESHKKNIRIQASAIARSARVKGTGVHRLSVGENRFVVQVTAENGKTRRYTIVVRKKGEASGGEEDDTPPEETQTPQ